MSAAEKLRALDAMIHYDRGPAGRPTEMRVLDALPQILAVVEAAERIKSVATSGDHALAGERLFENLYRALAALDEKLT